jgi:hypothetical protein
VHLPKLKSLVTVVVPRYQKCAWLLMQHRILHEPHHAVDDLRIWLALFPPIPTIDQLYNALLDVFPEMGLLSGSLYFSAEQYDE